MNFASDNWAGVAEPVARALFEASSGLAAAYGTSDLDKAVEARLSEIFERDVSVFFVGTGTAANALSMALVNKPGGIVFCHEAAHLIADECGAVETMTGGARLFPVQGRHGKMTPASLETAIERYPPNSVHGGQAMAVSITQATEAGTVYSIDEIKALGALAKTHHLPLHMDGARFANALVSLGTSPAEMTWQSGIDLLSFGATKNGCWCGEAVLVFDSTIASQMPYLRKRAAHLFSKTRFITAQLDAYLTDGLWLDLAGKANAQADSLAEIIQNTPRCRLAHSVEANEVFAILPRKLGDQLLAKGATFYPWPGETASQTLTENEQLYRFVTSFATQDSDITSFSELLGRPAQE